jgi:hypothetical protein
MHPLPFVAAALLALSPAAAAAQVIDAASPETVVNALHTLGYRASLEADSTGDPLIRSTMSGLKNTIYFYGCENGALCRELQFTIWLDLEAPVTLDQANAWNDGKIVGTAAVDAAGDVMLRFLVVTEGGMSMQAFERAMFRWEQALSDFKDHVNW